MVTTFDTDEPIDEVLDAARQLGSAYRFRLTGSLQRYHKRWGAELPPNTSLTGFLPDQDYVDLLASADVILVLTTREYTLNCGTYEALALGKPTVLSNTETIRSYFSAGAVYVAPESASIAAGIERIFEDLSRFRQEAEQLANHLRYEWDQSAAALADEIRAWERG